MVIHIENKQGEVKMALRKEIQGLVLTDYQISEAMWDGDELVILITPVPQSCFVARIKDKESIKKAFDVMQDNRIKDKESIKKAFNIMQDEQNKAIKVSETNATIAQKEREVELKQKEIELREKELDAVVRKEADATKYAAEQRAEAELIRRQREADAKAYEIKMHTETVTLTIRLETHCL